VANTLNAFRGGAVGFIVWLDVAVSGVKGVKARFGIVVQVTQLSL
jgi:hypothetical protein